MVNSKVHSLGVQNINFYQDTVVLIDRNHLKEINYILWFAHPEHLRLFKLQHHLKEFSEMRCSKNRLQHREEQTGKS